MIFLLFTDPDDSIAPPTQDHSITMTERCNAIRSNLETKRKSIFIFDLKHVYKIIYLAMGIVLNFQSHLLDPKVAIWYIFICLIAQIIFTYRNGNKII